jgi:hypothetical protein
MQTLHLSEQQVDAYLNDLATRLKTDSVRPDVLIGVGLSGSNILLQLVKFLSDFPEMKILFTNFDRAQEKITYFESIEKTDLIDPTEHIVTLAEVVAPAHLIKIKMVDTRTIFDHVEHNRIEEVDGRKWKGIVGAMDHLCETAHLVGAE